MDRDYAQGSEPGAERGRSPSGAPGSEAVKSSPLSGLSGDWSGAGSGVSARAGSAESSARGGVDSPGQRGVGGGESPGAEDDVLRLALQSPRRGAHGRRLVKAEKPKLQAFSAEQKILLLDTWKRSGLAAGDFASMVGVSSHTLYQWRKRFEEEGPGGLMEKPRGGPKGSKLSDLTQRTILMLKQSHPEWGVERIAHTLERGPGLGASPGAVARVLHEAGYELEEAAKPAHGIEPKRFERARPNELWQSDLFTFVLKRQNRRVYLVGFLDDHSRFLVGYGLYASPSSALVLETLRAAVGAWRAPKEILTDNGPQYVTWRGKSAFARELEKLGIEHLVAAPRRPQTLGKIERFWGTLWRECVEAAIFRDLEDARKRLGQFIDHYNFQRPHAGVEGLVPADRFFGAAPEVLRTLRERVASNALELARQGLPRAPFYLTGQAGGESFSVHAEGERVYLRRGEGEKEEVELAGAAAGDEVSLGAGQGGAPAVLPEPVCPSVAAGREGGAGDDAGEETPGRWPLDGILDDPQRREGTEGPQARERDPGDAGEGDGDDGGGGALGAPTPRFGPGGGGSQSAGARSVESGASEAAQDAGEREEVR